MSREIEVPTQTIPARTHRFRTTAIEIETPEGGPYRLRARREKITLEKGVEIAREPVQGSPILREFNPTGGEGLSEREATILGVLPAVVDGYAGEDGEGA